MPPPESTVIHALADSPTSTSMSTGVASPSAPPAPAMGGGCAVVWLGSPQPTVGGGRRVRTAETLSPAVTLALRRGGIHVDWWPLWPAVDPGWSSLGAVVLALGDDNLDALRAVRRAEVDRSGDHPAVPVVWVCATPTLGEQVMALEAGADLCLTWPISERELLARLRALMRRAGREVPPVEDRDAEPAGAPVEAGMPPSTAARSWPTALTLGAGRFGGWVLERALRRGTDPVLHADRP